MREGCYPNMNTPPPPLHHLTPTPDPAVEPHTNGPEPYEPNLVFGGPLPTSASGDTLMHDNNIPVSSYGASSYNGYQGGYYPPPNRAMPPPSQPPIMNGYQHDQHDQSNSPQAPGMQGPIMYENNYGACGGQLYNSSGFGSPRVYPPPDCLYGRAPEPGSFTESLFTPLPDIHVRNSAPGEHLGYNLAMLGDVGTYPLEEQNQSRRRNKYRKLTKRSLGKNSQSHLNETVVLQLPSQPPKTIPEAVTMYIDYLIAENEAKTEISTCEPFNKNMFIRFEDEEYAQQSLKKDVGFPTPKFQEWLRLYNFEVQVCHGQGDAGRKDQGDADGALLAGCAGPEDVQDTQKLAASDEGRQEHKATLGDGNEETPSDSFQDNEKSKEQPPETEGTQVAGLVLASQNKAANSRSENVRQTRSRKSSETSMAEDRKTVAAILGNLTESIGRQIDGAAETEKVNKPAKKATEKAKPKEKLEETVTKSGSLENSKSSKKSENSKVAGKQSRAQASGKSSQGKEAKETVQKPKKNVGKPEKVKKASKKTTFRVLTPAKTGVVVVTGDQAESCAKELARDSSLIFIVPASPDSGDLSDSAKVSQEAEDANDVKDKEPTERKKSLRKRQNSCSYFPEKRQRRRFNSQ